MKQLLKDMWNALIEARLERAKALHRNNIKCR
jgi:hypothetical protein